MRFNDTHITVELSHIFAYLKVDPEKKGFIKEAEKAYHLACSLSHPEVIYQKCSVRKDSSPLFFIDDVEFYNKALFHNLSDTNECFLYLVTLGKEFSAKLTDTSDYLVTYYLDKLGTLFLRKLREKLVVQIEQEYGVSNLSRMSPGSTALWPLRDNKKMFAVLGDNVREIGVSLSENHVMIPFKTVSGILFCKEERFVDCFLCQLTDCQSRQAGYNPQISKFYHNL